MLLDYKCNLLFCEQVIFHKRFGQILNKRHRVQSDKLLAANAIHDGNAACVRPKAVVHGRERNAGSDLIKKMTLHTHICIIQEC